MFWLNYFFMVKLYVTSIIFFSVILELSSTMESKKKCLAQGHDTPIGGFETYCRCVLESIGCLSPSRHE